MIARTPAYPIAHALDLPQTSEIPIEIDRRIWNEIVEHFPVIGEHHKTAIANAECRLVVTTFVLSALRDEYCCFSFNQTVLDHMYMVGAKKRKKLVNYFARSRFSTVEMNYSTGHHSIIRRLSGARICRSPRYQHNIVANESGVASALRSLPAVWAFAGDTVTIALPTAWFRCFGASYRDACSKLFQKQWLFVRCVESSISRCLISLPTLQECLNLAKQRPRTAECRTPEDKAGIWMDRWAEWREDPLLYLFRTAGRCYYPLVNQPKALRHRHLKFRHNGLIEDTAEVDMSATYWVLLARILDPSPCKEMLIQDLVTGHFYQRLNAEIGNGYEDPADLKRAVQKDCLFGQRNFGRTKLFTTMERIYPDLARLIRHFRINHPVRWLSDRLTNAEGEFFIDTVLPFVVNAGIPALPIHDAVVVPASTAERVKRCCCDLARAHFGFEPKFKITNGAVAL